MPSSNTRPEAIQKLGLALYAYNYQISEVVKPALREGEPETKGFEFKNVLFDHTPTRYEAINAVIGQQYPDGAENAVQRKGIVEATNPEFAEYLAFVEATKEMVKSDFQ